MIQPSTTTGTPDAPPVQTGPISKGVQNFMIQSGRETICTFNNSKAVLPPDIAAGVTKTANPTSIPETGGSVTYTVSVTNISASPATLTTLSDDKFFGITTTEHNGITATTCSLPQNTPSERG